MKFQAILNKIIILPDTTEEKRGSIYLPEAAKERKTWGRVVSIGEQVTSVKVGDHVMFKRWEVTEIKLNETLHYVVEDKPEHIVAIRED